jgi:hypothetical protein
MPIQWCTGFAGTTRRYDCDKLTELLLVWLISKGIEIFVCLRVGEEEEQAQEFAMDAAEVDMHDGKKATCRLRR